MAVTYYKRFRMEVDLAFLPQLAELPTGYRWVEWQLTAIDHHADVKYRCFHTELDAIIFPCLGNRVGCKQLMSEISRRRGFLPQATWLIDGPTGHVATVQGVAERGSKIGMIQNLGVVPEARGLGLGTAILLRSLHGFREAGLRRVILEVTAENIVALRMYRRVGFRRARTVYKAVEK